jgi:two-component system chemotaxis response regulator CheY
MCLETGGGVMGKKILVVDDSASMRQMVGFTLRGAGYEVVEAVDGRDGVSKLGSGPFNMVLTDLNMPNLDGLGLIRAVRSSATHKFVPVIMLTTESQDEKKQEGKAAGATGWIVKPFKPEQLLAVARKVLGG